MANTVYYILLSLVFIPLLVCIFLVWFFSHRAKHRERLMMMEKGIDPLATSNNSKRPSYSWQKIGIIIIGLSIGLAIISLLAGLKVLDKWGNAFPLAILGVCGGIAMVIANHLGNDKSQS